MPSRAAKDILELLPWRFFKKLALFQTVVTLMGVIGAGFVAHYTLESFILQQSRDRVSDSIHQIRTLILSTRQDPLDWCMALPKSSGPRITMVDLDGNVQCDNYADERSMDNHANREEIKEVLASPSRIGLKLRKSKTTGQQMLYGAVMVAPVGMRPMILRQAMALTEIQKSMWELDRALFPLLLVLVLVSGGLSAWGSMRASIPLKKIIRKLYRIQRAGALDKAWDQDEWALVETSIDRAHQDLDRYLEDLYLENRKLGTLMESIADSILAVNMNRQVLFANGPFKANFLPKEIENFNLTEFKALDLLEDQVVRDCFEEVLQTGTLVRRADLTLSSRSGEGHYYDLKVAPLKDSQERVFGAVGVFHDVTERRLAEQMREDFVTNVSHEVRTPLTAMKGHVQMLKEGPLAQSPETRASLEKIESNSDRITNLFNDVLNLSVIESKAQIDKEWVDLQELTTGVLADIEKGLPNKKLDVKLRIEAQSCLAAPLLLEQVITNLVVNAFKYTPEGGVVSIHWYKAHRWGGTELPGPCTILEVEDTGPGIPAEHLPRLFERFYRVDPSRSREMGGTGLGLAIVKHIMQKHGGPVLVSSVPGKGSAFAACFPDE